MRFARNVTDMASIFSHAHAFNQPIGSWNVHKVRDMRWMFQACWTQSRHLQLHASYKASYYTTTYVV